MPPSEAGAASRRPRGLRHGAGIVIPMVVLLGTHPRYLEHDAGPGHPEQAGRLRAVEAGIEAAAVAEAVVAFAPRAARRRELERVHSASYLDAVERFCRAGGGSLDPDTRASPCSWPAAVLAAGAGLDAVERLDRSEADVAFLAVRPPGHHAGSHRAMGFCLLNNAAVVSASLADRGERVLVLDWDVHHGNGTQEVFYEDPRVLYISLHQFPFYPGTGSRDEKGAGAGQGATINVPLPAGTRGDTYRRAFDEVVLPAAEQFAPSWLVISAGFDAHRDDPLADVELSAADFADLTRRALGLVPACRCVAFLEGGYDQRALAASVGATVAAMAGLSWRPEPATTGGPGLREVEAAKLAVEGVRGEPGA